MTEAASDRASRAGHGAVARLFHWTVAVMVVVQIPAGIAMTSEPLGAFADPLFILHKGMGAVLLVLVLARVVWRLTHRPPPFPDFMPSREQRIASATHAALYVMLVVMVVSGYVRTAGDGYPIELLDALGIPYRLPAMPDIAGAMLVVHPVLDSRARRARHGPRGRRRPTRAGGPESSAGSDVAAVAMIAPPGCG